MVRVQVQGSAGRTGSVGPVWEREVTGIQLTDPTGRTGLITLETPSAASAQEIPQLPGETAGHQGRCLLEPAGPRVCVCVCVCVCSK